jgi:hypothetical protein
MYNFKLFQTFGVGIVYIEFYSLRLKLYCTRKFSFPEGTVGSTEFCTPICMSLKKTI